MLQIILFLSKGKHNLIDSMTLKKLQRCTNLTHVPSNSHKNRHAHVVLVNKPAHQIDNAECTITTTCTTETLSSKMSRLWMILLRPNFPLTISQSPLSCRCFGVVLFVMEVSHLVIVWSIWGVHFVCR